MRSSTFSLSSDVAISLEQVFVTAFVSDYMNSRERLSLWIEFWKFAVSVAQMQNFLWSNTTLNSTEWFVFYCFKCQLWICKTKWVMTHASSPFLDWNNSPLNKNDLAEKAETVKWFGTWHINSLLIGHIDFY